MHVQPYHSIHELQTLAKNEHAAAAHAKLRAIILVRSVCHAPYLDHWRAVNV